MWDLVVVGLGPAGSTAARIAASNGLRVLAVDQAKFPRYKPCAAGLTGRAIPLIPVPISKYAEKKIFRAKISMGEHAPIDINNPDGLMWTTRRETLDTFLVKAAQNAGAEISENIKVRKVISLKTHAEIHCANNQVIESRFVIGADGANSVCARALSTVRRCFLPAWEVEFAYDPQLVPQLADSVRFDLGVVKRGYGWSFPKKETIAVGVAGRLNSRHEINLAFNAMMKRLPGSDSWEPIVERGHPIPIFSNKAELAGHRIILTGDAGGLIDPFLGEGIYYGLVSGRMGAEWVTRQLGKEFPDYQDYCNEVYGTIGSELRIAQRLAKVIYGIPGIMFRVTQRRPHVLQVFGESLCSSGGYNDFLGKVGLPYSLIFTGLR